MTMGESFKYLAGSRLGLGLGLGLGLRLGLGLKSFKYLAGSRSTDAPLVALVYLSVYPSSPTLPTRARYIRNLFVLVVAYGMSINMVEVTWKSKLKQARDP